ncbi:MAG: methionyl-tRNA formyltransferase [Microthrixaceae bacterium]|nr:methionyl-tRNA formyltransferase [Microthrixaceae bacterium]MCB1010046.1 methionyl-tRNA formyltransferase [Microthrixaceae bacterium]MCO5320111.1 methionyl-tRNA formyltransferase [Microthrixaceae bacterium]
MRLVYLGSPAMAVGPLEALHGAGHDIALVVTNPPRRRSRRGAPVPTPVGERAAELGLEVSHDLADTTGVGAELGVVVAFGRLIPVEVLNAVPMVNLHFSLLPRWRGAAPVERAILAGDETTGVCVMQVEEGLDTGAVYARAEVSIGDRTTAAELREQLTVVGSELLVKTLADGLGEATAQSGDGVTYASKLTNADRQLHWEESAVELDRIVRIGGAWSTLEGRRLKILEAEPVSAADEVDAAPGTIDGVAVHCGSGALRLSRVQPEGRAAMDAADFLNGARLSEGARLGT